MLRRLDGEVGAGAGVVPLPDRGRVAPGIHHQLQILPTPSVTGSDVDRPRPAPSGRAGRALDDEITTVGTLPDRGRLALGADLQDVQRNELLKEASDLGHKLILLELDVSEIREVTGEANSLLLEDDDPVLVEDRRSA